MTALSPVQNHEPRSAQARSPGINARLDRLPRTTLGASTREVPAFFACAVTGFYAALLMLAAGGLLTGRSLVVLAAIAAVSAASFFVWALGRRAATGRETLVLLEHVWFAELCVAGGLALAGEPVLPYLDVMAVAMSAFLAAGRVGCLLAGCCHGRPSSVGIAYGAEAMTAGFPPHLVGVRLLPVPAFEALALLAISLAGLIALPLAPSGTVFTGFLVVYAVTRFGLERLRGDDRPHVLGLSVNRWMCVAELAVAFAIVAPPRGTRQWVLAGALAVVLLGCLVARLRRDRRRRLLGGAHLRELSQLFAELAARASPTPELITTSAGVSLAVSRSERVHASFSTLGHPRDVWLLCELAARTVPTLEVESALLAGAVLHVSTCPHVGTDPKRLYGHVVRVLQRAME